MPPFCFYNFLFYFDYAFVKNDTENPYNEIIVNFPFFFFFNRTNLTRFLYFGSTFWDLKPLICFGSSLKFSGNRQFRTNTDNVQRNIRKWAPVLYQMFSDSWRPGLLRKRIWSVYILETRALVNITLTETNSVLENMF